MALRLTPSPCNYSQDVCFAADPSHSGTRFCSNGIPGHNTSINGGNITIVYGVTFIGHVDQKQMGLVSSQLESLQMAGLLNEPSVDVHIVVSHARGLQPSDNITKIDDPWGVLKGKVTQMAPRASMHFSRSNLFEYPAVHFLWAQACRNPESIYLYFHNKGATRTKHVWSNGIRSNRTLDEMILFQNVIAPWRDVTFLFSYHGEALQHMGIAPADAGWEWFNFFWARGSYLSRRVEPIFTSRRHYYEVWLARAAVHQDECSTLHNRTAEDQDMKIDGGCSVAYSLSSCKIANCTDANGANGTLQALQTLAL